MKKKAVIFDLWNTLIVKKGKNLTTSIAEYYSLPYESVYEWIRLSSLAKDKTDKYYYIKMICQANSISFREHDKIFFDNVFENYYKECDWIDGAKEILSDLKKKNYKTAILSNSSEISYNVIDKFKFRELVDDIVLSCEVGYLKPDPRIFQKSLQNLKLTEQDVVMVGDKITTDVLGAKTMGMDIIYFNRAEKEDILNPNLSFVAITNKLTNIFTILNNIENENNEVFPINLHSGKQNGAQIAY